MHPSPVDTTGSSTNELTVNTTRRPIRIQEGAFTAMGTPTRSGMNHRGTMKRMWRLNFLAKSDRSLANRSREATTPYPHGQLQRPWLGQCGQTNRMIQNAGGIHKTGTYTGNGTSQSITVGFQPKILRIFRWNETYPNQALKNDQMAGDDYLRINSDGTPVIDLANGITLTSTGFDLGSDSTINSDGNTYYWEAYG